MDGFGLTNNLTLYLMLIICTVLLTVDSIELYRLFTAWSMVGKIDTKLYEFCYKNEMLIKTAFSLFSFMAALTAFILTFFMVVCMEFFIDKLLASFLYMIYYIFGLYMLGFSVYGTLNWNDVIYVCDKKTFIHKVFSLGNMFSLLGCLILSVTITVGVSIYESVVVYSDTILRREGGSKVLRNVFWWAVFHGRSTEIRRGEAENANNNNQQENHIVEHENNQNQNQNQNP